MAILSEVVKQQAGLNPHSASMLTEIADSARGLVDSMSDIVWSIDPRRDDLHHLIARTRQFASDVLEAQGIQYEFHAPAEIGSIKLGPDQRRHLFLILKEAINNAAKHAQCQHVALKLAVNRNQFQAEINDDGRGFPVADIGAADNGATPTRGGNGLRNMQARATELGGQLQIDSTPNQGTRLTLTILLKQ
ncbi:MAG: ATP-binding protein [Deltaproteobacteria bacterium]|nr:ATP-binding protein [Deltaproteobacteria bacterium]